VDTPTSCSHYMFNLTSPNTQFVNQTTGVVVLSNATELAACAPLTTDVARDALGAHIGNTAYLLNLAAAVVLVVLPFQLYIACASTEHNMLAPWRGRWDDPTRFPKTSALDHASAFVRVGVAAYYLSFTGPVHFVASFRGTLASVVLLDGLGLLSLKRLLAPRKAEPAAGVQQV